MQHIVYELLDCDNWNAVDEIDCFLWIYDRMPRRMKLIVDLRMSGEDRESIAATLKIKPATVSNQLSLAKKRIVKALF